MNLYQEDYVKHIISFHKTTFENSFAAVNILQEQTEELMTSAWRQAPWVPEDGKLMMEHWIAALREGRKAFRQSVQDGFDRLEGNLIKGSAKQSTRKIDEATREQLEEILGIGEATADKIAYHLEHIGPIQSWEELQKNYSISADTLSRLQKNFTL
jgi:DNA uptake protein ComE-like DNA-binding protein